MGRFFTCISALSLVLTSAGTLAWADDGGANCAAIYENLRAELTGDVSVCEVPVAEPKFKECKAPSNYTAERPASHVVLILDASGSMAGKAGKEIKMAVAKEEALKFLSDLEKDVPVGLMVYGHKGNNKESGKAESCAATEWAHEIGGHKSDLSKSINALQPTGWTPLAGALEYAQGELAKLPMKKDDKISAPVVYLVSDGKETCGGDPVAAAKALHESGVHAAVNVIGFGVDAETRGQLEAISKAGGGRYFPADDSNALRKQLRAIAESENSAARYQYCINLNVGLAGVVYHNAKIDSVGCYTQEAKKKRYNILTKKVKAMRESDGPERACAKTVNALAYSDYAKDTKWFVERNKELSQASEKAVAAAKAKSIFSALGPKATSSPVESSIVPTKSAKSMQTETVSAAETAACIESSTSKRVSDKVGNEKTCTMKTPERLTMKIFESTEPGCRPIVIGVGPRSNTTSAVRLVTSHNDGKKYYSSVSLRNRALPDRLSGWVYYGALGGYPSESCDVLDFKLEEVLCARGQSLLADYEPCDDIYVEPPTIFKSTNIDK